MMGDLHYDACVSCAIMLQLRLSLFTDDRFVQSI